MLLFPAVCLAGALFSVLGAVIWFHRKNLAEGVVMGVIMWFFVHIFASMGLFLLDKYTVFRAACGAAAAAAAVLLLAVFLRRDVLFHNKGKLLRSDLSVKDLLIPIIISLMALPLVSLKNEFFGMGQDQGVYQTQAIMFMNGDTKRQKNFDEYFVLDTDEEKAVFEYNVKNHLRGYDIAPGDYPETVYDRSQGPVSGIIHGIPTYSALLAMWGTLFGMESMQGFETVCYICLIFLMHFICRNLKLKKAASVCACAAAAFAPVVVWVAKSALTEMLLALLPAVFLYFMTDGENPGQKWLSIIPVAVFACYHVSIYTMLPVFVMIYGGMYVFTREKQYAVLMPATIAGYFISYFMMRHIQPFYTMNNYRNVFVGGINVNNITAAVAAVSAVLFAVSLIFVFIVSRLTKKNFSSSAFCRSAAASKGFILLLRLMIILPCAYIGIKAIMSYDGWEEANHTAFAGFAGNAGIVLLPLGIIAALVFTKFFAEDTSRLVLFLMFFYCVLVYSAFLRYEIQYYYYYSRYLAPYIPVAALFCASALDRFGGKVLYPAAALGLLYVAPYDVFLMYNRDDSRMEWSVMRDAADFIKEDDCVVISLEYADELWLPLKEMTGAAIFPEDSTDPGQLEKLAEKYGRVLYLTEKLLNTDGDYSVMYTNRLHTVEDDLNTTGKLIPMSYRFWTDEKDISIYSYDKYRFIYTAAGDYPKFSGVSQLESYFCWTDSETAQIECGLYPGDYDMTLELAGVIPFDKIGTETIEVTVLLNGEELGTEAVTAGNIGSPLHFEVPEEIVEDGGNTLEIRSPLWSASVSNPEDSRQLGIPLQSVRFSPV